jgi:hypothetical protein
LLFGFDCPTVYNVKAATIAAFEDCEPDWTNLEPFYPEFKKLDCGAYFTMT